MSLMTVKAAAGVPPNCTAVASVKLVPLMTTVVPPDVGPIAGDTDVTVGACIAANMTVNPFVVPERLAAPGRVAVQRPNAKTFPIATSIDVVV